MGEGLERAGTAVCEYHVREARCSGGPCVKAPRMSPPPLLRQQAARHRSSELMIAARVVSRRYAVTRDFSNLEGEMNRGPFIIAHYHHST